MSRRASSSEYKSHAIVLSSNTEVDTEKLNTFLMYYVYNIYEDAKKKGEKIDIEKTIKNFNESMTRVCDIYMPMPMPMSMSMTKAKAKAKEKHSSSKSAEKPIIPDQTTLNTRFRKLFAFLQPPLLKTLARLATFTSGNIYDNTRVYYLDMHGNYDFTNIHSLKKTVPDNVILVFNTPINRFGVTPEKIDYTTIQEKLQKPDSRHNILSQIGCVDKHIDIEEFGRSSFQFKTFMSRALVLYPGQFYYNLGLSYNKKKPHDDDAGIYEINELNTLYYDLALATSDGQKLETDLETLITQIGKDKVKITYIFVDCCRSLDSTIMSFPESERVEPIKISSEIYENEHFMYYFNLVMSSCSESVESYIPRSLYKHMDHKDFEGIISDINYLLPKEDNEAKKIVVDMLKLAAINFYNKKINENGDGDKTIASFFELDISSISSNADDFDAEPITISHNLFEDCKDAFYTYIFLKKFIKDKLISQCLTLIINFIDNINGIIYMDGNFADLFIYALNPSYFYSEFLRSLILKLVGNKFYKESKALGLNKLEIIIKWFKIPLKNYDDFMDLISKLDHKIIERLKLPPIFKKNYVILKKMIDDLNNVLLKKDTAIVTNSDTLQDEFRGIKSYKILNSEPFDIDNNNYNYNYICLFFYLRNLFNASVEAYIREHPKSILPRSLILHKKSSMSRGSLSRSRAKKILTSQADLEFSKKIVEKLAIYSPLSLQAGGSKLYHRKTKKYKNYIKLY